MIMKTQITPKERKKLISEIMSYCKYLILFPTAPDCEYYRNKIDKIRQQLKQG